jgi:hypothetical protein
VIPVVADADTLFGATTRGPLIHLDYQGRIRLHWRPLILNELSRALVDTGRKPDAESARRHEQLMRAALPQAEIPTQQVQAQFASVAPAMRSAKDSRGSSSAPIVRTQGGATVDRRHPDPATAAPGGVVLVDQGRSSMLGSRMTPRQMEDGDDLASPPTSPPRRSSSPAARRPERDIP